MDIVLKFDQKIDGNQIRDQIEFVYNGLPDALGKYLIAMLDELRKDFPFRR